MVFFSKIEKRKQTCFNKDRVTERKENVTADKEES